MEMRELRGDDLFTILAILGKLDVKDELIRVFEDGAKVNKKMTEAEQQARGIRIMASITQQIFLNMNVVRDDINALLADLTSKSVTEITQLSMAEYTKLVLTVAKKPEIKEVFTSAVSLLTDKAPEQAPGTANTN